jgi:hypothetical protein
MYPGCDIIKRCFTASITNSVCWGCHLQVHAIHQLCSYTRKHHWCTVEAQVAQHVHCLPCMLGTCAPIQPASHTCRHALIDSLVSSARTFHSCFVSTARAFNSSMSAPAGAAAVLVVVDARFTAGARGSEGAAAALDSCSAATGSKS